MSCKQRDLCDFTMQYFFTKQDVKLELPHKVKEILSPSIDQLTHHQIPTDRIYCGFVAWEIIQTQEKIGKDNVVTIPENQIDSNLLPLKLQAYSDGGDLTQQLASIVNANSKKHTGQHRRQFRIALMNGTGTMLGDTIVGASVIELVAQHLLRLGVSIEIDIVLAWNSRPGGEKVWKRTPNVRQVFESSITVAALNEYDAYWDFSHLLRMSGYSTEHFGDFYFDHFGLDPRKIPDQFKLPIIRVNEREYAATCRFIQNYTIGAITIFLQAEASNPARSMPEDFLVKLIKALIKHLNCKIVLTRDLPKGLTNFENKHLLNAKNWTQNNLDRYISTAVAADAFVSVDTLALHVAMGCKKPGVGLFSLSPPEIRLKYSPQILGILIPNAQKLAYWEKHKSDQRWELAKKDYDMSWDQIEIATIIKKLQGCLAE